MYQAQISNIVIRLKKARNRNPEMTIQRISDQTGVSMSTVTRIFADGSENQSFRYESLKPICILLLDSDGLDEELPSDEVQMQISQIKEKYDAKIEKERAQYSKRIDFLMHQIELKDDRITRLMDTLDDRNEQYKELNKLYLEVMGKLMSERS